MMATLFRILLWLAWLAGAGWLWQAGKLGTASALALSAGSSAPSPSRHSAVRGPHGAAARRCR
ncbi:hypothetical protein ACEN8K_42455, partial [Variovorax sp. CT11-76]